MAKKSAKKAGRPPVPDELKKRRECRLTLSLWQHERDALDAAAGGRDVSTWVRKVSLAAAGYEEPEGDG
jgi:hypothetical protein